MVICHSYVGLPEGIFHAIGWINIDIQTDVIDYTGITDHRNDMNRMDVNY